MGEATAGGGGRPRGRIPALQVALVVVIAVGGAVLAFATWQQEVDSAERDAQATADRAGVLLAAIGSSIDTSLAGAAAVVGPDGAFDASAFEAFASQLTFGSDITALAFEPVVPAAARAEFEAMTGRPIIDRAAGQATPAAVRPEHYPVLTVVPASDTTQQVLGFDLLGDPVRAAAAAQARDSGITVFSVPVPSEPSGTLSIFLVKAVYRPGVAVDNTQARRANLVGFVSTAFLTERIADAMAFLLPEGTPYEIRDGDVIVAERGDADGGLVQSVAAASRQWTVTVDPEDEPDLGVPVLLVVLTLLFGGGVAYEFTRSARTAGEKEVESHRTEELAHLAEGLATRTSTEDVMGFLTTAVLPPLGAAHAAVAIIEGDRLRRHFTPAERVANAVQLLPDTVRLDARMPLAQAARTGEAILIGDVSQVRDRYPALVDGWLRLGFVATANLPLRDRNGQVLGALGVAWDRPVDFLELRDRLATVAGIAGQTIDRARLSDAEHRLVKAFQEGLLTPLPPCAGLELSERYLPATEDVGMGGDWYEGIVLDDQRYLVVVGDVAGHGIAAVATMARLRSTIGTIAGLGTPLAEILPRATSRPGEGELVIATATIVEIDLGAGQLRYVSAGHPPPLVRRPDGSVVTLDDGRQPLLGIAMEPRAAGTIAFPEGSTLVCFTDGLVERREEQIDESIGRLVTALERATATTAEALADELLSTCLPQAPEDDVVLTVVIRTTT